MTSSSGTKRSSIVPTIRNDAMASALRKSPTMTGNTTTRMPGTTISRSAALVVMSTVPAALAFFLVISVGFGTNASLPGYDSMFVPLHYYFNQALDLIGNTPLVRLAGPSAEATSPIMLLNSRSSRPPLFST